VPICMFYIQRKLLKMENLLSEVWIFLCERDGKNLKWRRLKGKMHKKKDVRDFILFLLETRTVQNIKIFAFVCFFGFLVISC